MRRKRYKKQPIATQSAKQQQPDTLTIDNIKLDTHNTTPANILHLQRTIGNTAVQRLLTTQNITTTQAPQAKPMIQRTGLRDEDAAGGFSSAVKAIYADPANADLGIEAFLIKLTPIVIESLSAIDVPKLKIVPDTTEGRHAYFDMEKWQISFSMVEAFKPENHVRDISEGELGGMINSLYHEARHAEQQFRVAQMLAGQKIPQEGKVTGKHRKDAKQLISEEMQLLPNRVIHQAIQNPIYDNPDGDNQAFEEAQAWHQEVFGEDKMYRNLMLHIKDDIMPDLTKWVNEAIERLDANANDLSFEIGWVEFYLDKLMLYEVLLDKELARVQSIGDTEQTANDVTMLYHLERLKWDFEQVKSLRPITVGNLRETEALKISINKEVYAAYLDLPTESDAWRTGNLAQSTYNDTLPEFSL